MKNNRGAVLDELMKNAHNAKINAESECDLLRGVNISTIRE